MTEARPGGFWIRALAMAIDFALFFLVQVSFGYAAGRVFGATVEAERAFLPTLWLFTLVFTGAYTTVLHALTGQTIGKMLVGVRVVGQDGALPALGVAALRYVAYFASVATLGFGYAMAGLREDKRALHDLLAGTRVERVAAGARREESAADPDTPAPVA